MSQLLKPLAAIACVATLVACTAKPNQGITGNRIDTNAIVSNKSLSPAEKSDQLARAGELLAQSSGFPLADVVIDQALAIDANNKVAQFYKAFLADKMALRGILVRVKPLVANNAESLAQLNETIAKMPNGALKDFLLDGQEDLRTEKDVQAFVDSLHDGREQLREFLKANKNSEITIRLADTVAAAAIESATRDCAVREVESGVYEGSAGCDLSSATEVKMNRADMEALQQIIAGVQVYSSLLNSYDLSGSIETAKKMQNQQNPTNKAVYAELAKNADFAKVRKPEQLRKIVELGVDAISGIRWAAQAQSELCPQGEDAKEQRKGYLFSDGICIRQQNGETSLESVLQQVELALSGRPMEVELEGQKTEIVPALALTNPVADLKDLRPRFNNCDKIQSVADSSLNGIFPNDDLNAFLALGSSCSSIR
jgi:hypothetical protein